MENIYNREEIYCTFVTKLLVQIGNLSDWKNESTHIDADTMCDENISR